jgi:hypothetical protein
MSIKFDKGFLQKNFVYESGRLLSNGEPIDDEGVFSLVVKLRVEELVWFYHHGLPKKPVSIQFFDKDPKNTAIENLYAVEIASLVSNAKKSQKSSSGLKGVSWDKNLKKWRAHLNRDYHHYYLGIFETMEEALAARMKAEIDHPKKKP